MTPKKRFPYRAAFVACNGGCHVKTQCDNGCISCNACVEACKFGAIVMGETNVPVVKEEKCIACGACTRACQQGIIKIHDCGNTIAVKCSNHQPAVQAREVCEYSCIACGLCERTCTAGAIHVSDYCAVIDESTCLSCGLCAVKCPRHSIVDLRGVLTR